MAGLRISGLATGMDIDSIVQDMIRAKRVPYDKMAQKKQTLEWKRDNYREMNTLLFSLREETLKMRLSTTFLAKNATSSNDNRISAKADSTAGNTSYTFNKVERLATTATNASENTISGSGGKIDTKASIYSLQGKFSGDIGNFNWKSTDIDGITENVKLSAASKTAKLEDLSGGTIQNIDNTAIQVKKADGTAGDTFTITTNPDDLANLAEDQVYVNKETGQLTFGKQLDAGSSFDLSYKYVQKESFTAGTSNEFRLKHPGITETENVKITVTTYERNADGSIKKDSSGKAIESGKTTHTFDNGSFTSSDGKITLDGETGKITFTDKPAEGTKIEAEYGYSVFESKMTSHTSKGQVTETFNFKAGDSFESILTKISKSDLGVTAFYDEYADKVTMTRTETGDYNANVYNADGTLATRNTEMSFLNDPFLKNILQLHGRNEAGGEDAKFTINGLDTGRHTNDFTLNGVTFTLKETFNDASPVTIGMSTDTEKVFENIKGFIDKYNETIEKINKKIGEDRYRDFTPLNSEQKEAMSEKEVELWEEKAKSGLLRRDQTLMNVLDKMRVDFYGAVDFEGSDQFKQLTAIGITTTNLYNVNKGKLEIDEEKLKAAINEDPEAVYQIFAADGETSSKKGIARRLRESLTTAIQNIEETAGSETKNQYTIGKNLDDLTERMTSFESRLKQYEDQYYKQFTAMEQAVQKMNQQSAYMMQQLGMGQQ
ncbi:flagellar filament capping protein FliD [Cytobacillus firmus]|uniref:Flagellar hook-associated protein 2 n=1 Tax=Cytobacillus firmus TaxID=1399 RepID=A0A800NDY0_CYTFI|nr:flagellar filament capping protein FliD [Cytobacillus firmus]KAF0825135.1 Flagellar cap protein FliD [Cytobacillus firmus]